MRITLFRVSLIVCILGIISFSRLGRGMVRHYGYSGNVSQGKRLHS